MTARNKEVIELLGLIKRVIFSQYTVFDHSMFFVEFALEAKLCHDHFEHQSLVRCSTAHN